MHPTQRKILSFIMDYKTDRRNDGNSPTYEEIAQAMGLHKSNVYRICQRMERRGLLRINHQGKLTIPGGRYLPPKN